MERITPSAGIALVVADRLKSGGISLRVASDQTGIPLTTLHRRLNGVDSFKIDELISIAALLGVEVSNLIPATEDVA